MSGAFNDTTTPGKGVTHFPPSCKGTISFGQPSAIPILLKASSVATSTFSSSTAPRLARAIANAAYISSQAILPEEAR